jgi:hypothetical protein
MIVAGTIYTARLPEDTGLGLIGPRVLAQTDAGVSRETVSKHLSALDNYVDETLKRTGVPGLSVAIVYEDRSSISKASA